MTEITETVLHDPAVVAAIAAAEAKMKAEAPIAPVAPPPAEAPPVQEPETPAPIEAKIEMTIPRVNHPTTTPPVGYNSRMVP